MRLILIILMFSYLLRRYSFLFYRGKLWKFNDIEQEYLENILAMTIFAFLTLNTVSSAHEEIFGAKFSSYERLRLCCLYTVGYAVGGWRT